MKTQTCGAYEGPFKVRGVYEKHLRQCKRKARYYCPDCNIFYCKIHLKKARTFDVNPIDIKTGKEVDRYILHHSGEIKLQGYTVRGLAIANFD